MNSVQDGRAEAVRLRAQGLSNEQIAGRLGVSRRRAAAWLRRPRTFAPRVCELCGQPFVPASGRQRFCTPAHRREQHRAGAPVRECRLCGQPFTPTDGRQRCCTPAHQRDYRNLYRAPTVRGWRQRVQTLEAELARLRDQLKEREAA